jgi:hypothetical protein
MVAEPPRLEGILMIVQFLSKMFKPYQILYQIPYYHILPKNIYGLLMVYQWWYDLTKKKSHAAAALHSQAPTLSVGPVGSLSGALVCGL